MFISALDLVGVGVGVELFDGAGLSSELVLLVLLISVGDVPMILVLFVLALVSHKQFLHLLK